jgi:hypothetical protein
MTYEEFIFDTVGNDNQLVESSEVKVKTLLNAAPTAQVIDKSSSFLNIGQNFLGHGLRKLGYNCVDVQSDPGQLLASGKSFDFVIAADEWLTMAETEDDQRDKLNMLSKLAHKGAFTTIKDYKNMSYNQRVFYEPFQLKSADGDIVLLKHRIWNTADRQVWQEQSYAIKKDKLLFTSSVNKRTMYFKQLAKFASDVGSKNFQVEKKMMYKSLFSKNQDYIVYISF